MTGYTVYIVTNLVNAKQYIGITSDMDRRWHEHQTDPGRVLFQAIKKYGIENFHISYIASAFDFESACDIERLLIKDRGTKAPAGYNLTDGGDGVVGYQHTEETKKQISEKMKGSKKSAETRAKMSAARLGIKYSEETKSKISASKKGKPSNRLGAKHSDESKALMSESQKTRYKTKEAV
jgi:group I intron endonuclease